MGDDHDGLTGSVAGHKSVDAGFLIHHIEFRHRDTTGNSHFLNDVAQFALVTVAGIGVNGPGANHFGDPVATSRQINPAEQGTQNNQGNNRNGGQQAMIGEQPVVERKTGGFTTGYKITHKADGKRDKRDRRQEKKNQQSGVAPGVGLALKETGMSHDSGPQKATFGA